MCLPLDGKLTNWTGPNSMLVLTEETFHVKISFNTGPRAVMCTRGGAEGAVAPLVAKLLKNAR